MAAVAIQAAMLAFKLETWEEAKVILDLPRRRHRHGDVQDLGRLLDLSRGRVLRIGGVPLFTGFMYAAIGSYIARAWRLFDFRFTHHPPLWALCCWRSASTSTSSPITTFGTPATLLFALTALLFGRCWIYFKVWRVHRRMPLLVGFVLVALFIWIAENVGTFTAAWMYPTSGTAGRWCRSASSAPGSC